MNRGEVWWADLPSPMGRRPVVLLSRDAAYPVRNAVTVAPITRTVRQIPAEVKLGPDDGMRDVCAIVLDNISTIPKHQLIRHVTTLSAHKMQSVSSAIKFALALD